MTTISQNKIAINWSRPVNFQRLIVSIAIKTSSLAINLPSDAHMIYVRDGATLLRLESGNDAAARAVNGMR